MNGVSVLDTSTNTFTHYKWDSTDSKSLSHDIVRSLYEDSEGTIWVGTGMEFDNDDFGGLNRFDRSTGTFTRFIYNPDDPTRLIDNKVRSIFEDSKGNFWIGTRGDGLHTLDRKTGLFTRYRYDPQNPDKLSRSKVTAWYDGITFIREDDQNQLWIGTNNNGISRYDPVTQKVTHYGDNTDGFGTFIDHTAWWSHIGEDGQIWMSSQENSFYRIDLYNNTLSHLPEIGTAFYEESPSVFWMGTVQGLIRIDEKSGIREVFGYDPNDDNSMTNSIVTSVAQDNKGILWIGTINGLNRFDYVTKKFTRYILDPGDSSSLNNNQINDIHIDSYQNVWIATNGGGLDKYDNSTGKFVHHTFSESANAISSNWVKNLSEDGSGNLWIGLSLGYVDKYDLEAGVFTSYPMENVVSNYIDEEKNIWIGTTHGLKQYDTESDTFIHVYDDKPIHSIVSDADNNLWIASSSGMVKYDKTLNEFVLLGQTRAKFVEFQPGAAYRRTDGQLYFGTASGHYKFYATDITLTSRSSKVYFTDLLLDGKSIKPKENGPLEKLIFEADKITLSYSQNAFAININEIDFSDGDRTIYYMLENYDEEWRQSFSGDKAYYFNVPPGNYIFRARAANNYNGSWAENEIKILITPPWYTSWWAITGYGFIFFAGIFAVDRFQRRRLIAREREKTRDRELAQAREIEKAYTELKATQQQLIHSEKMASLGELTAGIAHEIQNPLNFVNNFSDVNKELIRERIEEMKKGNVEEAESIGKDLIGNEEKILHHGKRADGIVKGMLQHSRGSSGEKELTDINELADEYLRLAYHGLRAKDKSFNADFKMELDPDLPKVNVVPQDIGRVLLNLINNAFHAVSQHESVLRSSKDGSEKESHASLQNKSAGQASASALSQSDYKPTVMVSTKHVPLGRGIKGEEIVQISVTDNGPGIPDEIKDKIFQPFFTTKSAGEGTGLGLSLSYDIITKGHGGEIKVESQARQGTEFLIILPV
jgi:signal transduction histidine kinase/streptogramin lyase